MELNIVPNVTCVMNLAMVNIDITDKMICTFKVELETNLRKV